jgi:hypothetical protein
VRGSVLLLCTLLAVALMVGAMFYISRKVEQALSSLDASGARRIPLAGASLSVENTLNVLLAVVAGFTAVAGAMAACVGATLTATPQMLPAPTGWSQPPNVISSMPLMAVSPPLAPSGAPALGASILPAQQQASVVRTCAQCGREVLPNARFCRGCGAKQD